MAIVGFSGVVRRARLACVPAVVVLAAASVFAGASGAAVSSTRAKGIDVSNWQHTINWTKVAGAGYKFAIAKATEATNYEDSTYAANRIGSEAAGLVFGAYHFARPSGLSLAGVTASAVAQADYFLAFATPQPGELPPVLDLEATGGLSARLLNAWTQAWAQEVYARLGVHPLIYSSPAFWGDYLADSTAVAAAGTPLWIAHWTSASQPWVPAQNWNGQGWTFWQWTDCVSVPGVAGCVDGDRMNGTRPASIAIAPYPQDAPAVSMPPSIVGPPEAGELLSAVPGIWNGGKPLAFAYQWRQCDAAGANCVDIAGATRESYRPTSNDVGHSLRVRVTAATGTATARATAPATVAVSPAGTPPSARPANVGAPVVSGAHQVGQKLTSTAGAWTGAPTKFTYRWQRCDSSGLNCVAIANARRSAYTTTPDDLGSTLAVVVTASGAGGSASAPAVKTAVIDAAPLPPLSTGSQTVVKGVAGNVGTTDGRATATWQPGAVPVGLTVGLDGVDPALGVAGSGVSLSVPGLPSTGFKWPVEVDYTAAADTDTVLGYSTDGTVFAAVPDIGVPTLPSGQTVGSYIAGDGTAHVLTRAPLDLSFFTAGAWGDPTYTSPTGPSLAQATPLRALVRAADRSVLVLTHLGVASQARLTASITSPTGSTVVILPRGSVFGSPLSAGRALASVQTERDRPGTVRVRLRLNDRRLAAGTYMLRVIAVDPWGRSSVLRFRFTLS
jgi:GH25 family lysozyme M1 (1,4-beta-N-acetylmuramidase)